jgi:hypothetical protein
MGVQVGSLQKLYCSVHARVDMSSSARYKVAAVPMRDDDGFVALKK